MKWDPHVTVATVVEKEGRFLVVEELADGKVVYNQPAGHVDGFETLEQAALRETLEETGWHVKLSGVIGIYCYTSPDNGVTYYRTCFSAEAIKEAEGYQLDKDIIAPRWKTLDELDAERDKMRSPLVLKCFKDYLSGRAMPLDFITEVHPGGWIQSPFNNPE